MVRDNGVNLSSFVQTTAANGITSYADGLYDTIQNKFQSAINADLYSKVGTATWDNITGKPTFATVATSGSYNDLTDKPNIPTIPISSGASTARPTNITVGYMYFDTTLSKPIYWSGTKWVDANGVALDDTVTQAGLVAKK